MSHLEEYKKQIFAKNPRWDNFNRDPEKYHFISDDSVHALNNCTESCDDNDKRKAFNSLEEYALNLVKYPWKDEIKTLKVS